MFSFLATQTAFGQINNNRFRVDLNSLDMGPCGGANDSNSEVGILAKNNTVNNFNIAFDLPDGVNYIPGTETITLQQGSSDYALTLVDMSDLNAPVFRLQRTNDANWEAADFISFRFDKTASCDAVQFSYAGGLFKDAHTITYDDLNGPQSVSDNDPTINTYNFLSAYLAVQNYNSVNSSIGSTVTRNLEITNSGNGNIYSIIHNVEVGSDLGSYVLSYNGTALTPVISGNTYTYTIDLGQAPFLGTVGDGDIEFENETIVFEESFVVQGCSNIEVSHQPTWGCSNTEICQIPMPFSGVVLLDTQPPSITITKINPPGATDLCIATTYTAHIANTATTGIAYDIEINTGFGYTTYVRTTPTQNGLWGNDYPNNTKSISNFRFSGQPVFTPVRKPVTHNAGVGNSIGSYFIPRDFFSTDPDGPGGFEDLDGDGFFDDMVAGASTDLLYDYSNDPRKTSCGTSAFEYVRPIQVMLDGYAQSQCGDYSTTYRRYMNNTLLRRGSVLTDVPTDVYNASPFMVGIQGYLSTYGTDPAKCNGQTLFSADPNSIYTITLIVPNGILLDGTPADFTQVDANTVVFSTSNLPTSNILNMNVEFPLVMDCGVYAGPENVPITYTTRFECSCFAEDIACGSIDGIRAKCGAACDGPQITFFEAERETAGWTDDTMTTKVVLDPSVHALNTYMAKDEMVIRANGRMNNSNPNNLFLDITYRPGSGGMDIINYVSGVLTINDLSTSGTVSTALTSPPIVIDDGGGNYRLRLDMTSYTSLVSTSYTYGEPSSIGGPPEADEISLELHYVFEEDFTTKTLYELSNFTGEFFSLDALGNRISCTNIGDRVRYFKNYVLAYDRNVTTAVGCNSAYVETLIQSSSLGVDRFPSEYRPPFVLQSTTVEIPAGAEFTGTVTSYDYSGTDPSTTNGGLIATVVGNTVVITPGASLREFDQGITHTPRLRTYFSGGTSSPASTPISWTTDYEEYSYSNTPINKSKTETQSFNFVPPSFVFTSPTPIVSGDQATAIFDIEMCKISTSAIAYNWLQINNGNDFTVLNAYEVNGNIETPLNFTMGTGATWIEAGQFTAGTNVCKTIRFEIDFIQCANFDFTAENGWDCAAYPSDFSSAAYQEMIDLSLEPKEAALQIAILDEPSGTVDICSNFNIDVELRNAGNGDLITPSLSFDIPGDATSLILNDIRVEYPRNSGNTQIVTYTLLGNTVTLILLDHTVIAGFNGIQGSLNANSIDDQIAIVQLDLSVQCNFTSNTAITYEATGNNNCGTAATGSGSRLSTNPIIVTGADPSYDAISAITVPTGGVFASCNTETITVETTIVGGQTSNLDYALIILPEGLSLDSSSFVSNNPTYPVTYTSSSIIGNHEEFIVNMPDGANNGANPSYSFDLTPTNTITSCSPGTQIQVFNFVVTSALVCGPIACGTTEIAAGGTFENVSIIKPELVASSFIPNADYTNDGDGNYEYSVQFGVENTGTIDLASGFVYDIYCLDGVGSKTGSSIYSGTVSQAIPTGNSITEDIIFTSTNFCGDNASMVVEFVPSSTNCHCDVLSIPLTSENEIADLEITMTIDNADVNAGDTALFTVTVTNNGPFDAQNISLESFIPSGVSIASIENSGSQVSNTITWAGFDLAIGETTTVTFSVLVNSATDTADEHLVISQISAVDEQDPDSTPKNYDGLPLEDDEAIYELFYEPSVDIEILKTSDKPTSFINDSVVFTITANNIGLDVATNISIEDILPNGFLLVSAEPTEGTYDEILGEWLILNLDPAATAELVISTTVIAASNYTNTASLSFVDQIDINSDNDSSSVTVGITQDECLTIYNEFSPNNDGANEFFFIECIEDYPNNNLQIFNRWGTKVFEMNGYDNSWDGTSTGRATINAQERLPVGTYYFTLEPGDGLTKPKAGWLYITR